MDRYQILKSLGKGGMGEVFVAYDPRCERKVALKCIRSELKEKKSMQARFLREAKIAAQLTHPSIVPIYTINENLLYYTMPYVEGETLRQILKTTKEQLKKVKDVPSEGSIPALLRIFLNVCEAISYAHSKQILHRDLKPENIIVGKYGEVMILDWGIAEMMEVCQSSESKAASGKVAGTVSYMAPERALGRPSSIQTEVYALGIILYQILTLELPFHRGNLAAFRKTLESEKLIDPRQMAPYREIPFELAEMTVKCLAFDQSQRFSSVDQLIQEIKKVIEGTPQWVFASKLSVAEKKDWEFQENVFLAKHIAITRHVEFMEWVSFMVSKKMFPGNIRIETEVLLKEQDTGIGFLFSIPELSQRKSLEQGYCLWLGNTSSQLFRSNVLVAENEKGGLSRNEWHRVRIEKTQAFVKVFVNDQLFISYNSRFPLSGTHVGVLHRDTNFQVKEIYIYQSSHNVMVNCLSLPDAFFIYRDYEHALLEYRKIAGSFPGREEGREALFRAGFTLLQQAKEIKNSREKKRLYQEALEEFEHLHNTPGAPLQYLGKSMVYEALQDFSEEVKCLEFALRKYPKHPLLSLFEEYILLRMHESSHKQRQAAYHLILLAVRYFPQVFNHKDTKQLLEGLQKHWEVPFFIEEAPQESLQARIAIILAFWVKNRSILMEIPSLLVKTEKKEKKSIQNALMSLVELGYHKEAKEVLQEMKKENIPCWGIEVALNGGMEKLTSLLRKAPSRLTKKQVRIISYLLRQQLQAYHFEEVRKFFSSLRPFQVSKEDLAYLDESLLWSLLASKNWKGAKTLLRRYNKEVLSSSFCPLNAAYGCFLYLTQSPEEAMVHFAQISEKVYPPTTALVGHYLMGKIHETKGWIQSAFYYEKKMLFQRLTLFFYCIGDKTKQKIFEKKVL